MKDFLEDNSCELIVAITIINCLFIVMAFISIPCLISEKRNIEKEIKLKEIEVQLKEIEVYGERIDKNE